MLRISSIPPAFSDPDAPNAKTAVRNAPTTVKIFIPFPLLMFPKLYHTTPHDTTDSRRRAQFVK
jgi:hypothetical protein